MNLGEAGESDITFDNLGDHVTDNPLEVDIDPDEQDVPEIDLDKQEAAGSKIPEKETSEKDEKPEEKKDEQEPKAQEQAAEEKAVEEAIEAMLEFGEEKFDLKKLAEDKTELERFQNLIKNGALMRSDYSKKTAAHAEAVKAWEGQKNADISKLRNYLSETNRIFNGSPMAFIKQSFSRDENGQLLSPEVVESRMKGWIDRLTNQLEQGSSYDPEADLKQFELEQRLNRVEEERQEALRKKHEAEEARKTQELSEHIVSSVLKSMPKDDVMSSFIEGMPGLKEKMVEAVINKVDKDRKEVYNEEDPTWDDRMFIDTYNFKKHWDEQLKLFTDAYDKSYEAYLARKKQASTRTATKASPKNANSGNEKERWTFDKLFAND